jgi:signal transduction histidine kinase
MPGIRPRGLIVLTGISFVFFLFAGCDSSWTGKGAAGPKIEFTSIPLAGADNPGKLFDIEGRVTGARPGQQIVIYCKGETKWWVQPRADQPFTKIESDSKWSNLTHPGTEYAALLVEPDFQPPLTADALPTAGVLASVVAKGEVAFWHRWWFLPLCVIVGAAAIIGAHRLRLYQMSRKLHERFEERLAERTRVAQELHDTLLQGVLSASMQLHVAVDQLPEDSPSRPALNRVLQLMGYVVEEGRNTLRGLRSTIDGAHDLESAFSRIPQEVSAEPGIDFRVVVEGVPAPLRSVIRDDVYLIGREALTNAFRHARSKSIDVNVEYAASYLRILIRDDGCGIDAEVLESGRDGHWGLSGMRERADRIGARLRVFSRPGGGTEVDLRVPSEIAFESVSSSSASKWLTKLQRRARSNDRSSEDRSSEDRGSEQKVG